MAVFGFGCTSNLIRGRTYGEAVALCLPGVMYSPNFWFTRFEKKLQTFQSTQLFIRFSFAKVPTEGVPLAEPGEADDSHLLGLDPGLPGVSGAVLQWHQPLGQEIHGHQTENSGNRLVSSQVYVLFCSYAFYQGVFQSLFSLSRSPDRQGPCAGQNQPAFI